MDESQIVDIWTLFKEYIDKKNVEVAAERFIDLLADYGVDDKTFKDAMGSDDSLGTKPCRIQWTIISQSSYQKCAITHQISGQLVVQIPVL